MSIPSATMVETFTGRFVDTKRPDPATICIEDIAHSLANTCRYGGHCQRFYSVAEHAVFVSVRLERAQVARGIVVAGLHHDDAEAYLGDIPRPLKPLLGKSYERLTDRMDAAIIEALGLINRQSHFHDWRVKAADDWALFVEARHLLPSRGINWAGSQLEAWGKAQSVGRIVTPDYWLGGLPPEEAERLYLERHKEVTTT